MGSVSVQSQAGTRGERLSAFVDGESFDDSGDLSQFLSGFTQKDRAAWSDYHLIGDALRSDDLAASPEASSAFMNAFSARFEAEAHVFAPAAIPAASAERARSGMFRRRVVPAFAVAAAAATLTWIVVPQLQGVDNHSGVQMASVSSSDHVQRVAMASVPAATLRSPVVEANIIRDASLDQYLEAHQQFSQQPVMPGSTPLIRTAATSQGQ
ncbi:MAG: sigma-E factor negative regulatory protein [Pseudomonadota bacterium]|uniref:sigma-E factor negative regulatory protein n=1 Tax=Burkholderia sp. PAMC 28687 TaxID=1795874 RepID=UPI000783C289|nr:sigma-E factor negative regulatory protein [Burkholderia sp. PAMC 28687]AMM14508.1 anti-sigma factor [Burkholderia sp. PAMC 28687]MDP9156260.1 sigma-E factor negative regulatory protein [Pseudomonadota bacterium]